MIFLLYSVHCQERGRERDRDSKFEGCTESDEINYKNGTPFHGVHHDFVANILDPCGVQIHNLEMIKKINYY